MWSFQGAPIGSLYETNELCIVRRYDRTAGVMEVMEGVPWARDGVLAGEKETEWGHKGAYMETWKRCETETAAVILILGISMRKGKSSRRELRREIVFLQPEAQHEQSCSGWTVLGGREQNQCRPTMCSLWLWIKSFQAGCSFSSSLHSLQEPKEYLLFHWWR